MGVSRGLLAVAVAAGVAGTGCFGGTANPSYFPYYLPPGDKIETHAKPAGQGYFNDFDPKAATIEITPATGGAAVNSDHVLIATVFDADGQARRKRRVEWILDGPGEILEVDESGILPGRGYREGNHRAVSYTSFRGHTFERGTRDPGDDFRIEAGQTWCIVRSAKPGETTVTAFAPAIHNHDKRTATARITWGGSGDLPAPPRVARGGETAGTSAALPRDTPRETSPAGRPPKLTLSADAPAAAGFGRELAVTLAAGNDGGLATTPVTLRLDLPGDAEFLRSDPAPTKQDGTQVSWAVGTVAPTGRQRVQLFLRPKRKGDLSLVAAAETSDGLRADARAVVAVGGAALELRVDAVGPAEAGGTVPVTVTLTNPGVAPADHALAWVTVPEGLESATGTNPVELAFDTVPGNAERKLTAELVARKPGQFVVPVNLTADAGIVEKASATVEVKPAPPPKVPTLPPLGAPRPPPLAAPPKAAALMLDSLDFPATVAEGSEGQVRVTLRNAGTADAEDIRVVVAVGDGLRVLGGTGADRSAADVLVGSVEFRPLDRLPPGAKAVYLVNLEGVTPRSSSSSPSPPLPRHSRSGHVPRSRW
jgi:hypothetical protein